MSERPLSPHLQVYRWQLPMALSIFHRATGIALSVGTLLLVYWLSAIAAGPESYAAAQALLGSVLGKLVLFGFTFCLFYHLCNGIRHLFWDAGKGFDIPAVYASGRAVLVAAVVLTLAAWAAGLTLGGAA